MASRRRRAVVPRSLLLLAASSPALAGCDARDENLAEMGRPAGSIDVSRSNRGGRVPGEVPIPVPVPVEVPIREQPVEAPVPSAEAPPQVP